MAQLILDSTQLMLGITQEIPAHDGKHDQLSKKAGNHSFTWGLHGGCPCSETQPNQVEILIKDCTTVVYTTARHLNKRALQALRMELGTSKIPTESETKLTATCVKGERDSSRTGEGPIFHEMDGIVTRSFQNFNVPRHSNICSISEYCLELMLS